MRASAAGKATTASGVHVCATQTSKPPTATMSKWARGDDGERLSNNAVDAATAPNQKPAKPSASTFCPGSHRKAVRVTIVAGKQIAGWSETLGNDRITATRRI